MSIHLVTKKTINVSGNIVNIKYWCDENTVYAAGFDENGKQITAMTYSAIVADIAKDFSEAFHMPLIDGLVETIESDLISNPDLHYRP